MIGICKFTFSFLSLFSGLLLGREGESNKMTTKYIKRKEADVTFTCIRVVGLIKFPITIKKGLPICMVKNIQKKPFPLSKLDLKYFSTRGNM